jgi:hypothetical protein
MAGIGIGPDEFDVLGIEDPAERAEACARRLEPRLRLLGTPLAAGLSRVVGRDVSPLVGTSLRKRGGGIGEVFVAFAENPAATRGAPCLALAVSPGHLHARISVRGDSRRVPAMSAAVAREAANLARRGKPFRRLRAYTGWDFDHLPEIAPAASVAFWTEVADGLAGSPRRPPLADLGVAWPREEARVLAIGDVLGAFRDLAPVFKLLANAGERAGAPQP